MGVFAYDVVPDSTAVVLRLSYAKYDYTKREWYAKVVKDEERPHWADPYVGLTSTSVVDKFLHARL